MLLIIIITGTTMMMGTISNRQDFLVRQQAELLNQMQLAKEALLAYAANSSAIYGDTRGPGFFPCPDIVNTNSADPVAGRANSSCDGGLINLGRLPEYIDTPTPKFFFNSYYAKTDQQFWYAIAPGFVYDAVNPGNSRAENRTSISASRLNLDGTGNIVAVIIAPGDALSFQNRSAAPLSSSNYLEGENGDNDADFATSDVTNPVGFNDLILTITHDELITYIESSAAVKMKGWLDADFAVQLQYPANQADFADVLASHPWLNAGNIEQWTMDTIYTSLSPTQAAIQFNGCPGILFTLEPNVPISRDGDSCI